jgi:hypothetical protein
MSQRSAPQPASHYWLVQRVCGRQSWELEPSLNSSVSVHSHSMNTGFWSKLKSANTANTANTAGLWDLPASPPGSGILASMLVHSAKCIGRCAPARKRWPCFGNLLQVLPMRRPSITRPDVTAAALQHVTFSMHRRCARSLLNRYSASSPQCDFPVPVGPQIRETHVLAPPARGAHNPEVVRSKRTAGTPRLKTCFVPAWRRGSARGS